MEVGNGRRQRRRRNEGGAAWGGMPRARRIAIAAAIRERRLFPYHRFGKVHMLRGTQASLDAYGRWYREATPIQQQRRRNDGWIGRGKYKFKGGFQANANLQARGNVFGQKYKLAGTGGGAFYGGNGSYSADLHGDANQLINKMGSSVAMKVLDTENTLLITNREFIGDVTPPTTAASFYTAFSGNINPGLNNLFPWLSQIALYYEEYEFVQLIFEFKSMVTEGNTNAQGNIIMATQYNATNPLFANKQTMENYDYANSSKVTQNAYHGVECAPQLSAGGALYVRTGTVPTGQDTKTYDLGIFQLAVNNPYTTSSLNLGELWVSYSIKLRKSKLILPGLDFSPVVFDAVYSFASTSLANLFTSSLTRITNTNSIADVTANSSNTITLPSFIAGGTYQITCVLSLAAGIGYTWSAPSAYTNCALATGSGAYLKATTTVSGTSNPNWIMFYIVVTGPAPTITFSTPTGTYVSSTTGNLYVSQVSSSIA
jgi:Viral coat protein (S domain)